MCRSILGSAARSAIMSPKKGPAAAKDTKGKKKTTAQAQEPQLTRPKVTDAEIADAKKTLEDKDAKRRANSNMMYWLEQRGEKTAYENLEPQKRKQFAVEWFAWSLKDSNVTKSSSRRVNQQTKNSDTGRWLSRETMIKEFGEKKALAKIALLETKPDRHRPDRDTGLDDADNREYLVFNDEQQGNTITDMMHLLESSKDVASEAEKKEADEDIRALIDAGSGQSSSSTSAATGSVAGTPAPVVKVEGAKANEDLKTFYACQSKPKQVLRTLSDTVVDLKRMFELCADPKRKRYTEALSADIGKLLPKMKTDFGNLEKIFTRASTESPMPDSEILATARRLDQHYEEAATITEWFNRMCPKSSLKPEKPES